MNIGLNMSNYFALRTGKIEQAHYDRLQNIIQMNLRLEDLEDINQEDFFTAIKKDKKNKDGQYCFIIPTDYGVVERQYFPINEETDQLIKDYFEQEYK